MRNSQFGFISAPSFSWTRTTNHSLKPTCLKLFTLERFQGLICSYCIRAMPLVPNMVIKMLLFPVLSATTSSRPGSTSWTGSESWKLFRIALETSMSAQTNSHVGSCRCLLLRSVTWIITGPWTAATPSTRCVPCSCTHTCLQSPTRPPAWGGATSTSASAQVAIQSIQRSIHTPWVTRTQTGD